MIAERVITLILLACGIQAHAKFLGLETSFVGVDVHGSPDHGHGDHHGHSDHGHGQGAHHEEHHGAGHDTHGSAHGEHEGDHGGHSASEPVAIGLMAFVILTPIVMSMLMTQAAGGQVSYLTFRLIDMATSIFLAVLCFSAFGEVIHNIFPHAEAIIEVVMVLALYVLTMFVAYTLREEKMSLFIFCGVAAHFIAFATIQAAVVAQEHSGNLVDHAAGSFGFCILLFAVFVIMSVVCFYSWRRYTKSEELNVAIDELELDVAGLVLSFVLVQALRHALSGVYPAPAHLFLQLSAHSNDSGHGHGHATDAQQTQMLLFAIGLTILACLSLWVLNKLKDRTHYWMHKFLHVVEIVLVMCAAWGYLLWGQWRFAETHNHGDKMYGNMTFAVVLTIFSLIIIVGLAFATNGRFSSAKGYARLCVMAVSLVTAWSWEHCFHTAINIVANEYQVGYGGLIPKIIIATVIPLVVLPGYVVFLKPIVLEKEEQFDADDEDTERKDLAEVMNIEPTSPRPSGEGATGTQ